MKFDEFDPKAVTTTAFVPMRKDLVLQIESDFIVARGNGDKKGMAILEERKKLVLGAKTDDKAREAYTEHAKKHVVIAV